MTGGCISSGYVRFHVLGVFIDTNLHVLASDFDRHHGTDGIQPQPTGLGGSEASSEFRQADY